MEGFAPPSPHPPCTPLHPPQLHTYCRHCAEQPARGTCSAWRIRSCCACGATCSCAQPPKRARGGGFQVCVCVFCGTNVRVYGMNVSMGVTLSWVLHKFEGAGCPCAAPTDEHVPHCLLMAIFFLLAYHLRYAASFCPRPFRATISPPHPPTPSTFSSLSPRGKLQQQHSLLLEVALLQVADSGRSLAWAIEHKVMTATSCSSGSSQCAALSAAAAAGRMQGMQLELTLRPAPNQQQLAA